MINSNVNNGSTNQETSRTIIHSNIKKIAKSAPTMKAEKKVAILKMLKDMPLMKRDIEVLKNLNDQDFAPFAEKVMTKRNEDFVSVLEESGASTLEEYCEYMGIDNDSGVEALIFQAHAYKTVGVPGDPKSVVLI